MATTLGKRKRRADIEDATSAAPTDTASDEKLQAFFRQHFEAKYKPLDILPLAPAPPTPTTNDPTSLSESEWEGLDPDEHSPNLQIIAHTPHPRPLNSLPKAELKTFMTPKPPLPAPLSTSHRTAPLQPPPPRSSSPTSLAHATNDLALHRLLTESHLLSASATTEPAGALRHKATELRVLALGAKKSLHEQRKMPMGHRKGIERKKAEREEERRREARENGVVLEREGGGARARGRDRGVGGPGVGRWRGGMLVLGKGDVDVIEGRGDGVGKGRRGGGRGRGRGR